mgnify:CR=1 FL=1
MSEQKLELFDLLDDISLKTDFYLEEDVELQTKEAKRAMKNYFRHIQVRSSAATLLLVKFGQVEASKVNQGLIDTQLNAFMKDMNTDIEYTKQILVDAGITSLVNVTGGVKGTIKITSPTGFQFINIIKLWDVLNINLTTLYMRQEIGQEEIIKSTTQWHHRFKKFNNLVERLSVTAYSATEKLKNESRQKTEQRKIDLKRLDEKKAARRKSKAA